MRPRRLGKDIRATYPTTSVSMLWGPVPLRNASLPYIVSKASKAKPFSVTARLSSPLILAAYQKASLYQGLCGTPRACTAIDLGLRVRKHTCNLPHWELHWPLDLRPKSLEPSCPHYLGPSLLVCLGVINRLTMSNQLSPRVRDARGHSRGHDLRPAAAAADRHRIRHSLSER